MSEIQRAWRGNGRGQEEPSGSALVRGEESNHASPGGLAPAPSVPAHATGYSTVTAVAGPVDFRAGTAALAAMPDEEFEVRLNT